MRNLHVFGAGIAILAMLIGCRSGMSSAMLPSEAGSSRYLASGCHAGSLTLHVRVPSSYDVAKIEVTDSIYGYATVARCSIEISQCPPSGGERVCTVHVTPLDAVNDIEIAYRLGSKPESGSFPVKPGTTEVTAVLGGSMASISIGPFLGSYLPVGQSENVWVVARDRQGDPIIGSYSSPISIRTSSYLKASPTTLNSSADGEKLRLWWTSPLTVPAKFAGHLTAIASASLKKTVAIDPASGIVYFHIEPNTANVAPGPVAIAPDRKSVYFVINDNTECSAPGDCNGKIGRFDLASQTFSYVPLKNVPGISQLFFSSDGTLWMATFAPLGAWQHFLPVLRMPGGALSTPSPLPSGFGEASGFTEYPPGTLWISGCLGIYCLQNHSGTPILVQTAVAGTPSASPSPIPLPLSCAKFGYLGFTVGDVSYSGSNLYILGLNDGSAPPARGMIWSVSPASGYASCVSNLPGDFNPSPYFATIMGSGGGNMLVFGAGGNPNNFRWPPNHGFYTLSNGKLKAPAPDSTPHATAYHLSQHDGIVYYIHENNLADGIDVAGLGDYEPLSGDWNVFPSGSFDGPQSDDGVAGTDDGAWFTASSVCTHPPAGEAWHGVCLGRARFLPNFGVAPGLRLPNIRIGTGTGFTPLIVHSGPPREENAKSGNPEACATHRPSLRSEIFTVTGQGKGGICPITITDGTHSEPLVTIVATPAP
ncbi:MAG: hypothetical protein WCC84_14590 [Candidatus Cybelea sp.]